MREKHGLAVVAFATASMLEQQQPGVRSARFWSAGLLSSVTIPLDLAEAAAVSSVAAVGAWVAVVIKQKLL